MQRIYRCSGFTGAADLPVQRIYQIACGYEDGYDANSLRHDPVFKPGVGRLPPDEDNPPASASTLPRLENSVSARDIYWLAQAFTDAFVASYAALPEVIVPDMDHSEAPAHGQQAFSFFNRHYGHYCYLPLFVFDSL